MRGCRQDESGEVWKMADWTGLHTSHPRTSLLTLLRWLGALKVEQSGQPAMPPQPAASIVRKYHAFAPRSPPPLWGCRDGQEQ